MIRQRPSHALATALASGDRAVFPPSDRLKRIAVVHDCSLEEGKRRAVRRAEAVIARAAADFDRWISAELDRLDEARRDWRANPEDHAARAALFAVAHDLRGMAATLGHPLAGRICGSLARLVEHADVLPARLVDQHVEAARAVVREAVRDSSDPVAAALADELGRLVEEIIVRPAA